MARLQWGNYRTPADALGNIDSLAANGYAYLAEVSNVSQGDQYMKVLVDLGATGVTTQAGSPSLILFLVADPPGDGSGYPDPPGAAAGVIPASYQAGSIPANPSTTFKRGQTPVDLVIPPGKHKLLVKNELISTGNLPTGTTVTGYRYTPESV